MKALAACLALLCCVLTTGSPARADSAPAYAVSINAYWQLSAFCQIGYCVTPSPNPVVDQFSAMFDVYADGSLVPKSMVFSFSDSYLATYYGAEPLAFGPPPACGHPECFGGYSGQPGQPYPFGDFTWSDSQGYFVNFAGPSLPSSGTEFMNVGGEYYYDANFGINCVPEPGYNCGGLFDCYDISCGTGGEEPASGGYIVVSPLPVTTPEPSTSLLLGIGILMVFAIPRGRARTSQSAGESS